MENSTYSYDLFDMVFPSNEVILEAMIWPEIVFEDLHHKSVFIQELIKIEKLDFHVIVAKGVESSS